jgi:sec-independent protein translocase protein TatB
MLPSLGFNEILILGVLALVVVGPKDLPLLFRKLGKWTAKLRGMAQEFRTGFDELARQAELDELKREVEALRRTTTNPLAEVTRELTKPLPTLEDYAGIKSPPKLPAPALDTPEGDAPVEPSAPYTDPLDPQPLPRDVDLTSDSASERGTKDVPEHADAAPVRRSVP